MRAFQTVTAILFSSIFAIALATTDTSSAPAELNFRPDNVTLGNLYRWVGSYYNGSTSLKFSPYAGLAASETEYCPILRNKTITTNYKTILALTEPASFNNLKDDPVNAFFTLWPPGFNFSVINDWELIQEMPHLEYALFSSDLIYNSYFGNSFNNFIWSLEETKAQPYNLSSTLSDYPGFNYWEVNRTTECGETKVLSWIFDQITFGTSFNGTKFTNPVLSLQFDSTTANLSMEGNFQAIVTNNSILGPDLPQEAENTFVFMGKFAMTFEGVIDAYHSDILRNEPPQPGSVLLAIRIIP
ncbi:hypothetical protein N7488_001117 [Penicillium malachiteum]|nr:hypothetical protein N7488_001117 [Penicillium malachiteum]